MEADDDTGGGEGTGVALRPTPTDIMFDHYNSNMTKCRGIII